MYNKPYLGEEINHGKSGFAVNRGAVNRGFTVHNNIIFKELHPNLSVRNVSS